MQTLQSTFIFKSADDEGLIVGIASTPKLDKHGDTVDPLGAQYELPLPLLSEHGGHHIGMVEKAESTAEGIKVWARIAKDANPRCKELWKDIKSGLKAAFSIGFAPIESKNTDTGKHYSMWQWLELSIVENPANTDAQIQVVKHFSNTATKGEKMNIQQQIAAKQAEKQALAQANEALVTKSAMSDDDQTAYDKNKAELGRIEKHIEMLKETEAALIKSAVPIDPATVNTQEAGSQARAGIVTVKSNLPKGTGFARYALALAKSKGNLMQAVEIAKSYKDTPQVETVLKAAVQAGTTTDPTWAAPLVDYQTMTSEFMELVYPETILGQIKGFRNVPPNIKVQAQTSGASVQWVGQGKLKPVSSLAFETIELGNTKLSGIVPITDELARYSNPQAEALIARDLRETVAEFLDSAFIDPTKAATSISPASITHGVAGIVASGTDALAVKKDVLAVQAQFIEANLSIKGAYWVMSPIRAAALAMMSNELGNAAFPDIHANGGTFFGIPVLTTLKAQDNIILFNPSEIYMVDDGMVTLDASKEASLLMSDDPENDKATIQPISLWQAGMLAFKVDKYINFKVRKAASIAMITGAAYTA